MGKDTEQMKTVVVYAVGSSVTIGNDIPAIITAAILRARDHVAYECSWWNGRSHECKWLEEREIKMSVEQICQQTFTAIGFRPAISSR